MGAYITDRFVPLRAHIKERGVLFHRFDVLWTPTVLVLDASGIERRRSEGYLPRDEFLAELHIGEARISFVRKQWADAERLYQGVVEQFPQTAVAPEAMYWRGVCLYKRTNEHAALHDLTAAFDRQYPNSIWARKASIWRTQ